MTDSDVYLPSASSSESCDTSYLSSKEEIEVASTVQPYEGEPRVSNEDFDEDWQKRFLACSFQVKSRSKNSHYWIFILLRFCFVFYGESYAENGWCVRFCYHNILFLRNKCGEGSPCSVL